MYTYQTQQLRALVADRSEALTRTTLPQEISRSGWRIGRQESRIRGNRMRDFVVNVKVIGAEIEEFLAIAWLCHLLV